MTIRSHVNIRNLNECFSAFETGCDRAPDGTFLLAKNIREITGAHCDALLADLKRYNIAACNCDGIREIEAMMFGMIAEKNLDNAIGHEINAVVGLGYIEEGRGLDEAILAIDRQRRFLAELA